MIKQKLITIDFLRVVFAASVMIYHYNTWSNQDTNGILDILSIYAVEGFFVISGIVLMYNYFDNYTTKKYFIHRFFRIVPLFYLAVILELLRHYNSTYFGYKDLETLGIGVLSNLSFFNIFQPYRASVVSSWSIMVEGGFYIVFPMVLYMFKHYNIKKVFLLISFISIFIYIIFNFFVFDQSLGFQNNFYTNIFFHLHFFLFGMLIGYLKLKNINCFSLPVIIILIIGLIYLIDINSYADIIHNENRIVLSVITLLVIGYFTFNDWLSEIPKQLQNIIKAFSNLTYSIYLLHFFVFYTFYNILEYKNIYIMMMVTIGLSIPIYYLYEKKFILLGKKYA